MTSLTFHMARSIEDYLRNLPAYPNINIIVSNLCHDANVSPWVSFLRKPLYCMCGMYLTFQVRLAENLGIEVRCLDFLHESCTIDLTDLDRKLDDKTKLVAIGMASNACGTINPVKQIIRQYCISNELNYYSRTLENCLAMTPLNALRFFTFTPTLARKPHIKKREKKIIQSFFQYFEVS